MRGSQYPSGPRHSVLERENKLNLNDPRLSPPAWAILKKHFIEATITFYNSQLYNVQIPRKDDHQNTLIWRFCHKRILCRQRDLNPRPSNSHCQQTSCFQSAIPS